MLSDDDRRRLDAIAQELERNDPGLAGRLGERPWARRGFLTRVVAPALLVVGVFGVLTGLLLGDGVVFVVGGLAPAMTAAWLYRWTPFGHRSR